MYFGYSEIWRFTFVPVGFVITMLTFVALCLVYAYGAKRDARAVARYVRAVSLGFLAASVVDLGLAIATGQLGRFVAAFGWAPLMEMIVLAIMCVGSMWFMAVAYANSKAREARGE